jgi:hypothetical protein
VAPPPKSQGSIELKVSIELEDVQKGEEEPQLAAYAFSPGGSLIGHAPLKAKSGVALKIPAREDAQAVRVVVGPLSSAEQETPLADLLRLNAAERTIRVEPGTAGAEAEFIIARPIWLCWWLGRCMVRGTLLKREQSGGIPIDMPVCGAEVEVYEVEAIPILLARIPEDLLELLRAVVRFPPPPSPPPGEGLFGPLPAAEGPELGAIRELLTAAQGQVAIPASPLPPSPQGDFVTHSELAQLAEERFAAQQQGTEVAGAQQQGGTEVAGESQQTLALAPAPVEAPSLEDAAAAVRALAGSSAVAQAASQGAAAFRNALLGNEELVRPIFCLFFPWLVTKELVATTTTDECGHFSAIFWRGCSSERANLYFMAYRRLLPFFRIPIYEPLPIVCNTFWSYVCGTEVTLYTSSPLAFTCPPCRPIVAAPHWVLVMAIGNTPLSRIYGTGAALVTTPENVGLTDSGAPFGGLLRPRLEFDNSLRDELGVRYYRVSWKKSGSGNPWTPLELEVHRHYAQVVGSSVVLEAYSLGPHVVGGQAALFEIPPALPPVGQWSVPDAVEDTTSAKFPTGGSQPATFGLVPPGSEGIYKLRVELFDAAGAPVAIGPLGIHFVVPTSTDLSSTIYTTDAAALGLVPGPPVDTGNAFVMRLHVDNNPTSAAIAPPLLNGSVPPDPNCGVISYAPDGSDTLTIAYIASHPHGFANYSFVLNRGVTTLTPPSASGPVGAGSFSSSPAVSSLLGACTVAGFAEELCVAGTATDGWTRQGYDASALRAFVLKPSSP